MEWRACRGQLDGRLFQHRSDGLCWLDRRILKGVLHPHRSKAVGLSTASKPLGQFSAGRV